jgi:hypothetical protein
MEAAFALRPGKDPEIEMRVAEEPDLVVEFSIARAHGRSIIGRAPEAVIGPVPGEWLLDVGDRQLAAWERLADDADHAELMVLTACRIWRFATERVHCSKTAAGRWALEHDPSLSAVDEAVRQRTLDPTVTIGSEGIRRLLALVRQELRDHSASASPGEQIHPTETPVSDPIHVVASAPAASDPRFEETVVLDGMWRVPDEHAERGRRYRIAWFDPPFRPPLEETTQALGICFTGDRRIVLVTWNGEHWSLPGGSLEPGETVEQALAREVREEACARVVISRYIGCQRVEELDSDRPTYYQTRFWRTSSSTSSGPSTR